MALLKEFTKDAFVYGLGRGIKKFIGLFLLPFYTRALTPSDYGVLETVGVLAFFVTAFFDIGLNASTARYYYMAKSEYEKGRVLFTGLVFRLLIIVPSVLLSLFSKNISLLLFQDDKYTWLIFVTCMVIPFNLLNQEQSNILRFLRTPWKFNVLTLIKMLLSLSFGLTLVVVLKQGPLGAQLASLITSVILFIFSYLFYNRKKYTYKFSKYWAFKMLKFGLPMIWASIAAWFYQVSDRYILLYFHDTTELGLYSIGLRFAQAILLLNMAVDLSYKPIIINQYEDEEDNDKPITKKLTNDVFYLYTVVAVLLAIMISIFSTEIISFLATEKYIKGALSIPFLLFSHVIYQSRIFTSMGIGFKEKTKHFMWMLSLTAFINIGLNFYFIPTYSFIGAAFTTMLASVVYFFIASFIGKKYFSINQRILQIASFWTIGLLFSLFFPFAQLRYNMDISFWYKIPVFLLFLPFPFVFGLVKFETVKKAIFMIKN